MTQYIDKSALVAEIERREGLLDLDNPLGRGGMVELECLKNTLNTLEVKEVDLEEDINDFINEEYHYTEYEGKWVDEKDWRDSIQRCAKYFFELGLKAQKEE